MFIQILILIYLNVWILMCQIKVDPDTGLFIDQFGRYQLFHGVNVVYKTFPFYPPNLEQFDPQLSFSDKDAYNLNSWGLNFIRLHVAWEGVEPTRGQINQTYLEQIKKIVTICKNNNLTVLLDMHQDLYSRYFCGEGFPDWVMENLSFPDPFSYNIGRDEKGIPLYQDCMKEVFFKYYFTKAVGENSEKIFTLENIAEEFANFWAIVVTYFKDEPNVIGYEIINEPFGVSPYNHFKDFVWPGVQNDKYIMPFYKIINDKIRQIDKEKLVFFEPAIFDLLSGGFQDNIGGPEYKNREVFSYHIYCGLVNEEGEPYSNLLCKFIDNYFFEGKIENFKRLKVGGFMTEFGALSNSSDSLQELNYLLNLADSQFQSWSYWQFKNYNDITTMVSPFVEGLYNQEGQIEIYKLLTLSRPYAKYICGKPISMSFNDYNFVFQLKYLPNENGCNNHPTIIWVNQQFYYQQGFEIDFENCIQCQLIPSKYNQQQFEVTGVQESIKINGHYVVGIIIRQRNRYYADS